MTDGMKKIKKDHIFKYMRAETERRFGKEEAERILCNAGKRYEKLCGIYKNDPKMVKFHTENNIFLGAAIYAALKEIHPECAMQIMDEGMKTAGESTGKMLAGMVRFPGGRGLFMYLFPVLCRKMFGAASTFKWENFEATKTYAKMDIVECPYCRYCNELGIPELTHVFCDSDDYSYGNLPGILFRRQGTLGRGDACCDFYIEKMDKSV